MKNTTSLIADFRTYSGSIYPSIANIKIQASRDIIKIIYFSLKIDIINFVIIFPVLFKSFCRCLCSRFKKDIKRFKCWEKG